jgi:hypothetical protein
VHAEIAQNRHKIEEGEGTGNIAGNASNGGSTANGGNDPLQPVQLARVVSRLGVRRPDGGKG